MIIRHQSSNKPQITPIKAFQDNYIWAMIEDQNLIIVDPGDAKPVLEFISHSKLNLLSILITHKHLDHMGGVDEIYTKYPNIEIYAPRDSNFSFPYKAVGEGEEFKIDGTSMNFKVLETPGHTLDHIVYINESNLFCGDTLFACGCGRIFEGTYNQMFESLQKFKKLDADMKVFCAHEYTVKNIEFALTLNPTNKKLLNRLKSCLNQEVTLPSSLKEEFETNPFLLAKDVNQFKEIRQQKDVF
ncbi:MAG: hydroxyacylglutathione hydrolase [Methylophilaceae bacterium]|jgi:hydroxyacylglutathione hydrolase